MTLFKTLWKKLTSLTWTKKNLEPTLKESEDYVVIPDTETDSWQVRILRGEFVETVLGEIRVTWSDTLNMFSYSYKIISSPNEELTELDEDLQLYVLELIESIARDEKWQISN